MNKKSQRGMGVLLIELCIAMACSAVLLAGSTVGILRLTTIHNQTVAHNRMHVVALAEFQVAYCNIPANNCNAMPLARTIPQPGTVTVESYVYTFTQVDANTWTYTATPTNPGVTGQIAYYVDSTGVLTCDLTGQGANSGSQVCQ